jgi:O-methyltransferase involved in polyketide biosynthesis
MTEKIKIDLGTVQMTLLMPLWGRAKEYGKPQPIVNDKYAFELINSLDHDFDRMSAAYDEIYQLNWAIRAYNIDKAIVNIIERYPDATIINIGAGLDTTFQRIDNGKIFWYDLDLPDTIELRKKLIPESERNTYIAKSAFDMTWLSDIKVRGSKIFIVAAGVLCYFEKELVKNLFLNLIQEFPESEIIFESMSKFLIWLTNRSVVHKKEKAELAFMKWGVSSSRPIRKWSDKIQSVDEYPMYSRIKLNGEWTGHSISQMRISDFFKWSNMIHLKFIK